MIVRVIKPGTDIVEEDGHTNKTIPMFKSYLQTAWRNLRKNKVFSLINIAGLAIGIAACLLILQYVNFELSYDQFNKNVKDIYRVSNDRYQHGKLIQHGTITYSGVGKALQDDYPEVINHARVKPYGDVIIKIDDKKIADQSAIGVDNSFFEMFSYDLLAGNKTSALKDPYSVIITQDAAKRYFGTQVDPSALIGKTLYMATDSSPYKITGVCKSIPENAHLACDIFVSYLTIYSAHNANSNYQQADYDFTESDFWHYIQLKKGTNYKTLERKLPAFSDRHFQGDKVSGSVEKFHLQPLGSAYLYSDFEYEIGSTGSATVVWGLLIIALFIIAIAWVNYINLSTAKAAERAKEVGVRKVTGATRSQLIRQFLMESFLINLIALTIAIFLVVTLQPFFNSLIQHQLSLATLLQKSLGGYSVVIGLLVLLLAGIFISAFYPAFVLSSFRPIMVLKGKFTASKKGIFLRRGLVVAQFAITIALMIGSFVVYRQIKFMNAQELGLNIDQVLIVRPPTMTQFDSSFIMKVASFKEELKKNAAIKGATTSGTVAGDEMSRSFSAHRADDNSGNKYTIRKGSADFDFLNVYNIKLLAGRNLQFTDYNPDFKKLHNILINAAAVKQLGFTSNEDALGKGIMLGPKEWTVVGVMNDYHQKSLRYVMEPIILQPLYGPYSPISVKVDAANIASAVASIKKTYANFFPGNVFDYNFLDDKFNAQYRNDQLFGKAFSIFSGFAVFIACLGLLGLSLFATTQRIKEIGVRKVLGASSGNIVLLLSRDFIKLICIAFLIATPIAWYVMHQWLQEFAYRINIEWWLFATAGLLSLIVALATISFQSIRAALMNPVKALRTE